MEGFELKPLQPEGADMDDSSQCPDDDYCYDCGNDMDDCICGDDDLEYADDETISELLDEVLPESVDPVIILNGKVPKDEDARKDLIADLYKLAVRANEPAFAFQTADHKTKGDLKVTPLGRVLLFNAETNRWTAWYDITLSK